ncbi:MAG: beta-propeller domain-containing protein [Candidatus Bathyarchaeota archaeon]|nr:beta-propeller domain-containing protein [Candidatus Bathyarchaeota archaeon]
MVQKEVMKKTRNYGLIGVLLAVLLVATIYSYGVTPGISPNIPPFAAHEVSPMKTFESYDELKSFLSASETNNGNSYWMTVPGGGVGEFTLSLDTRNSVPTVAPAPAAAEQGAKDFSTTNIQVAGVDEADTVKTDGEYLYMVGNNSQAIYILDANPQNARVLAKISFSDAYLSGIYLSEDGSKLAVFGNQYVRYFVDNKVSDEYSSELALPYWNSGTTFVYVYDVSSKASPTLARNFTMSGNYVNSRMIGDYLYGIVTETAYVVNDTVILPAVFAGPQVANVSPKDIYYASASDTYYSYTTVVSLNIMDATQQPTNMTIMMGGTGNIYVSASNIYITYPDIEYETITPTTSPTATPTLDKDNSSQTIIARPEYPIMHPIWQGTIIYRVSVSGASLTFAAQGNVTGNVHNQYAMDESNGYFRIVTTSYEYESETSWSGIRQNNVYVLNMDLDVVGKLENLGTGENFHSSRFIGNRLYMVTYLNTDPLFVIDLSQPTNPTLLGELIIPGYSDYLHPYDETHLIGLGKDAVVEEGIDFAWYQGLKLSLFDVSNVNAPTEMAKIIIGDRGTSSDALYDPKAFLFDPSRNMLVLPVNLYLIVEPTYEPDRPTPKNDDAVDTMPIKPIIGSGSSSSQYGTFVWQGAYIFEVSLDGGFVVKGNVTQLDDAAALMNDPTLPIRSDYPWTDYNHYLTRSLYIDDVLYTFSQSRVQLNSLDDFSVLAIVELD